MHPVMPSLLLLAAFLLSGCLVGPDGKDSPSGSESADSSGQDGTPERRSPLAGDAQLPLDEVFLSGCTAHFDAVELPSAVGFGSPPEGWDPTPPPTSQGIVQSWFCERIGLGSLEVGPVALVMEAHTNASPQNDCTPRTWTRIIHRVGTTEDGLSAALAKAWGIPVETLSAQQQMSPNGAVVNLTTTWAFEEGLESSIDSRWVRALPNYQSSASQWVGVHEGKSVILSLNSSHTFGPLNNRASLGSFSSDGLFGNSGYSVLPMIGDTLEAADASVNAKRFDNPWCASRT